MATSALTEGVAPRWQKLRRAGRHVRGKSCAARRRGQGPKAREAGRSEAKNLDGAEHSATICRSDGRQPRHSRARVAAGTGLAFGSGRALVEPNIWLFM